VGRCGEVGWPVGGGRGKHRGDTANGVGGDAVVGEGYKGEGQGGGRGSGRGAPSRAPYAHATTTEAGGVAKSPPRSLVGAGAGRYAPLLVQSGFLPVIARRCIATDTLIAAAGLYRPP
jgi:hypothetical protein